MFLCIHTPIPSTTLRHIGSRSNSCIPPSKMSDFLQSSSSSFLSRSEGNSSPNTNSRSRYNRNMSSYRNRNSMYCKPSSRSTTHSTDMPNSRCIRNRNCTGCTPRSPSRHSRRQTTNSRRRNSKCPNRCPIYGNRKSPMYSRGLNMSFRFR